MSLFAILWHLLKPGINVLLVWICKTNQFHKYATLSICTKLMTGLIEIGEQLKNSPIFWKSDINNMNISIDKILFSMLDTIRDHVNVI
jgi:hypothetical protein